MTVYEAQVRDYLRYVRVEGAKLKLQGFPLDKRYHPTADGCVKLVHGDAKAIREAYVKVTSSSDEKEARAS